MLYASISASDVDGVKINDEFLKSLFKETLSFKEGGSVVGNKGGTLVVVQQLLIVDKFNRSLLFDVLE